MRPTTKRIEPWRTAGAIGDVNGYYQFHWKDKKVAVIASDGAGWEHVSVSTADWTPDWDLMSYVKDLFWSGEEWVVQFHPATSQHVNLHPHCLHLWKPIGISFPIPHSILVGPRPPSDQKVWLPKTTE